MRQRVLNIDEQDTRMSSFVSQLNKNQMDVLTQTCLYYLLVMVQILPSYNPDEYTANGPDLVTKVFSERGKYHKN